MTEFEHFERGYLLPKGCKDLIDVINLRPPPAAKIWLEPGPALASQPPPGGAELCVPEPITVAELASLLKQKPYRIIADLMQLGVFATLSQCVGFEVVSKICGKYGYIAKRSA